MKGDSRPRPHNNSLLERAQDKRQAILKQLEELSRQKQSLEEAIRLSKCEEKP
jgi:hypothetical protein